jgi:hypothetical protein
VVSRDLGILCEEGIPYKVLEYLRRQRRGLDKGARQNAPCSLEHSQGEKRKSSVRVKS